MAKAGCQINLDLGEGQISQGVMIEDFRNPCSEINITFESPVKLTFTADSRCYFTFKGNDWVPCAFRESVTQNGTYHYQINAFPRPFFDTIESPTEDTRSLAKSMGLDLVLDGQSLKIKCPIVGLTASQLVNEYRNQSYKNAFREHDMGQAYFIYFDSKNLLSVTLSKLVNQVAQTYVLPDYLQPTTITSYIDERIDSSLRSFRKVGAWRQNDFLQKIMGRKFEIKSTVPAAFLRMYTMKFDDTNEFDTDCSYLCVRSEQTLTEANGYIHTFAEMNYVK